MSGLALRSNLLAAWTEGSFVLCKPGGKDERDSLWVVTDGDVDHPMELLTEDNGWMDDDIVELAISCDKGYLMIRGVVTCYVVTLPPAPDRLADALPCTFLYEDVQVTTSHFHPSCDAVLYTLVDSHTVCVYDCATTDLLGVLPLHLDAQDDSDKEGLVVSMSPVYNTAGPAAYYLFTGSMEGTIELFAPIVVPGVSMPGTTLVGIDPVLDNEVRNKAASAIPTTSDGEFMTVHPAHLAGGHIQAPYQRRVGSVDGPVFTLRAQEIDGKVTVLAATATKAVLFSVHVDTSAENDDDDNDDDDAPVAKPVGSVLTSITFATAPRSVDLNFDRYRYFIAGGGGTRDAGVLCLAHPGGIAAINTAAGKAGEMVKAAAPMVHREAGGERTAGQVVAGCVLYRDAHPELLYATLYTPEATGHGVANSELVVDHMDAEMAQPGKAGSSAEAPAHIADNDAPAEGTGLGAASMDALVKWSKASKSAVPQATRHDLLSHVSRVSQRLGPAGLDTAEAQIAEHEKCRSAFTSILDVLQAACRAKQQQLVALQAEHRAALAAVEKLGSERCAALTSRLDRLRQDARSGKHHTPRLLNDAMQGAVRPHVHLLSAKRVIASVGAFRAHLADASISPTPQLEARCGRQCRAVRPVPDSDPAVSVVEFDDGSTCTLPDAVLEGAETTRIEQWGQAIDLAATLDDETLGKAEADARLATSSLRWVQGEFAAALKSEQAAAAAAAQR